MAAGYAGIVDFTGLPIGAIHAVVVPGYHGILDFTGLPTGIEASGSPVISPTPAPSLPSGGIVRRHRRTILHEDPQVVVTRIGRMAVVESKDGFNAMGEARESDEQIAAASRLRALRVIILTS